MKRQKIDGSSNIAEIGYNPEKMKLQVKFHNGSIYNYYPVTKDGYDLLMQSKSKGSFLNKNFIKNELLTCKRVG